MDSATGNGFYRPLLSLLSITVTLAGLGNTKILLLVGLFHTLVGDAVQQRGVSVLDRFLWTYVTRAKELGCRKHPSRGQRPEELSVILFKSRNKLEVVHFFILGITVLRPHCRTKFFSLKVIDWITAGVTVVWLPHGQLVAPLRRLRSVN